MPTNHVDGTDLTTRRILCDSVLGQQIPNPEEAKEAAVADTAPVEPHLELPSRAEGPEQGLARTAFKISRIPLR